MKILIIIILSTLLSFSGIYILREKIFKVNDKAPDNKMIVNENNFYTLSAKDIDGKSIDFSKFKGKKVLIVNVASKCGYTSQKRNLKLIRR